MDLKIKRGKTQVKKNAESRAELEKTLA